MTEQDKIIQAGFMCIIGVIPVWLMVFWLVGRETLHRWRHRS